MNRYLIWLHLFFQRKWLNKRAPERLEAETDTDEENACKSVKSLAKTEYKLQTSGRHGRYLNILWLIKEERNPKNKAVHH